MKNKSVENPDRIGQVHYRHVVFDFGFMSVSYLNQTRKNNEPTYNFSSCSAVINLMIGLFPWRFSSILGMNYILDHL